MKQEKEALSIGKEEIKSLMEGVLDEKLKPILRKLTVNEKRGSTVSEIVGGIGYIFGLMGVAIYFKNRKKIK